MYNDEVVLFLSSCDRFYVHGLASRRIFKHLAHQVVEECCNAEDEE